MKITSSLDSGSLTQIGELCVRRCIKRPSFSYISDHVADRGQPSRWLLFPRTWIITFECVDPVRNGFLKFLRSSFRQLTKAINSLVLDAEAETRLPQLVTDFTTRLYHVPKPSNTQSHCTTVRQSETIHSTPRHLQRRRLILQAPLTRNVGHPSVYSSLRIEANGARKLRQLAPATNLPNQQPRFNE